MEISKEVIEATGLSEDQVKAINEFNSSTLIPGIKKTYDEEYSSTANTNAEKIITGAANLVQEKTGITRNEGEKLADYNLRAFNTFANDKITTLEQKTTEYNEKVKNFKGDEELKNSFSTLQSKFDKLQSKEADYDALLSSGVKDDKDRLQNENIQLKELLAFGSSKPNFPETVNKFEADAKWLSFKEGILQENTIEVVDGKTLVISKENKHKQSTLDDLVAKDSALQELLKGRQQNGFNAAPSTMTKVEGIPFDVPTGADSKVRTELIKDHLTKQNMSPTDPQWASKFQELYAKLAKVA